MFTLFDPSRQKLPIKVWLEHADALEAVCLQQALNLSNLPFAQGWIALMPDTHSGYGMPIGGVLATREVIIPNAVGVDIGCGVIFERTSVKVGEVFKGTIGKRLLEVMVSEILRAIPTGFEHHKEKQACEAAERFEKVLESIELRSFEKPLLQETERACFQVGTLGGGNHFIELQEDDEGYLCLMVHSGSRNIGHTLCSHFNKLAKSLSGKLQWQIPAKWDLAYLPVNSPEGRAYIQWMGFALDFAHENREVMLARVRHIVEKALAPRLANEAFEILEHHHCHHNYAALERHDGEALWIHRKGAIRVAEGETGIIPGAMGSWSYLVKGKGSAESFNSCSHGAGRQMSRHEAKRRFTLQETLRDLELENVVLGKVKKGDLSEESRWAYKDIDAVIGNELDLIEPIKRMKTLAVVKG
ncbi:RtcB family protein [Acidaminobacter hydrogenoformans]|uniref:3'-phosphate/5'-hydroxy nucleic acid ligase n=1 Tax=Acidaminobacter hydrogenoformans DSM 2784 TaxID=1120920 RepID=A0A1G5S4E8_9FIRM|nr:RtcB family protein [Acidaminobacter hydrogenoformans]SCZ80710.1 tRNA-splicing ligase RtcB [Acidaminobacter hydrogenoformans DSM 2784]